MKLTPSQLKWILRTYPPFFFQRIWVKKVHEGFRGIDVVIRKSFLNINSNGTLFGGTIFSALDPIHSILLSQILEHKGLKKSIAWLKSAQISYLKPGSTDLQFTVRIDESEIENAMQEITEKGKVIRTFTTEVFDKNGVKCVECQNEVYIRDLNFDFTKLN